MIRIITILLIVVTLDCGCQAIQNAKNDYSNAMSDPETVTLINQKKEKVIDFTDQILDTTTIPESFHQPITAGIAFLSSFWLGIILGKKKRKRS